MQPSTSPTARKRTRDRNNAALFAGQALAGVAVLAFRASIAVAVEVQVDPWIVDEVIG